MDHRVGEEARRRIGVAAAALDAGDRYMRWRGITSRAGSVVTARAIRVARLMSINTADPAYKGRRGAGVAASAVLSVSRNVIRERGRALRTLCAL